ncbi:hypothetical protein KHP62_11245 [Rhodobacteraceae bacterium NNCM2]|nr:hypothetical protein [Coraliihabitans acroporae]
MSISGSGSYFAFDGLIAQSGNLADGALSVSGGIYSFASFDTAINSSDGPQSVSGSISLSSGALVRIEDLFGDADRGAGFPLGATVGRSYDAGHQAYGRLSISDGAKLTLAPEAIYVPGAGVFGGYDTLNVGIGAGGTGVVDISGAGAQLATTGTNPVARFGGAGGSGALSISDGGTARLFSLQAGFGVAEATEATGHISVSGAGSRLLLSGGYGAYVHPAYAGLAGTTTIGLAFDSGSPSVTCKGYLSIADGGEVRLENIDGVTDFPLLRFGRDRLSQGVGLVDGAGSRLAVIQHGPAGDQYAGGATLDIGEAGQGLLTVTNGGGVEVRGDRALLAISRPQPGVSATDLTSKLTINQGGTVTVDSGAYSGAMVLIGGGDRANAAVEVSGAGSKLGVTSDGAGQDGQPRQGASMFVGYGGNGSLTISDGALVEIDGHGDPMTGFFIGLQGGEGAAVIDAASLDVSSTSDKGGRIVIGRDAGSEASLTISNGASLTFSSSSGVTSVAESDGATGSIIVEGSGSTFTSDGTLIVGASLGSENQVSATGGGDGTLELRDGGAVTGDATVVGSTGRLVLAGGVLQSDLTLHGKLELSPGEISTERIDGNVDLVEGAVLAIDVFDFADGMTDQLVLSAGHALDLAEIALTLSTRSEARFFAGDSFVFATTAVDHPPQTDYVVDSVSGRSVKLVLDGETLRIEAVHGSPITLRDDGTIESVTLPSLRSYLEAQGAEPTAAPWSGGIPEPASVIDLGPPDLPDF